MKIFRSILIRICLLLLGIVVGLSLPYKWNSEITETALFPFDAHRWDRIFDIINAFLLFITLLTAIFKEQIIASIYHAKFEIKNDNDYREIVENTDTGSKANCYEKILMVQNTGNKSALNCRLIIDTVSIKNESDYHETELKLKESVILPLSFSPSSNQLKPQGSFSFSLFRILPKINAHDDIPEVQMAFLIGDNKIEIKQGKTDYIIAFHIEAEDIQSPSSKIVVHWNGKWQNRKTEMKRVLSIEHV